MRKIQYYKSMGCLKKKIFILFFSIAAFAFADENTIELSLEDAVKSALKNNVSVKQSEISLDAKKRESDYSWNSISPSISGTGRYSKNIPSSSSDDKASLSAGISLSATLSPSVYTSAKNAELSYSQQQLSYQNDLRSVELDVRKNYYSLLYKIEEISLKEKSLETSKNQYESNLAKYKRGTLSRLDVLSAQVSYQNDQLELKSLNAEMENSIASFKRLVGLPQETKISLSGSFQLKEWNLIHSALNLCKNRLTVQKILCLLLGSLLMDQAFQLLILIIILLLTAARIGTTMEL